MHEVRNAGKQEEEAGVGGGGRIQQHERSEDLTVRACQVIIDLLECD